MSRLDKKADLKRPDEEYFLQRIREEATKVDLHRFLSQWPLQPSSDGKGTENEYGRYMRLSARATAVASVVDLVAEGRQGETWQSYKLHKAMALLAEALFNWEYRNDTMFFDNPIIASNAINNCLKTAEVWVRQITDPTPPRSLR